MNNGHVLYISRLTMHNIRCFREDIVIDFTQPHDEKPSWTLILGDNGTGKTTLLRCIAMCLCDETSASGLLTELTGEVIRHGCDEAAIELQLKSSSEPATECTIITTLQKSDSGAEELDQVTKPDKDFPRDQVFACGYGSAFGTIGSEVYDKYRLLYSLLSLFDYHTRLWNPENALFRISREGFDVDDLLARLERILMLPPGSIQLDSSGLQVRGPWGNFVPAGALGDGYAATISWICDFFGWSLLAKRESFDTDLRGIVLLDEMEQHLHPSWQRAIIRLLAADFSGIQFIATTNAPLIAIGSTALADECCQLVLLEQAGDGVVSLPGLPPPRGRRADQVVTSYLFGLATSGDDETKEQIHRFSALASRKRSAEEEAEFQILTEGLDRKLGSAETKLEEYVQKAVRKVLGQTPPPEALDESSVGYEALRQIRRLLEEGNSP